MVLETEFLFKIINLICYAVGGLAITLIIVIESYINYNKKTELYERIFNALAMSVYILYLLQIILSSLAMFTGSFGCTYISPVVIAFHFPGRGVYFSIFIIRIYIIFKSCPSLKYSTKLLIILFSTVIIFAILLSFLYIYDHINNAYYDIESQRCVSSIPFYLLGITAFYDLSFNMLTLYLFIKKLRILIIESSDHNNTELQKLILKSSVLVIMSIFTSVMIAGIYAPLLSMGLNIITTDWIINSICIALMKTDYDKYYKQLCFYPNKCINFCCLKRFNDDIENMKSIDIVFNNNHKLQSPVPTKSKSGNETTTKSVTEIVYESTTENN